MKACYQPTQGEEGAPAAGIKARLSLEITSFQEWVLPALLLPLRWAVGDALQAEVTSRLELDPGTGRVVQHSDTVMGWPVVPLPVRILFGLGVPLFSTLCRP